MSDLDPKDADDAAKRARFSKGFGLVAGGVALAVCCRFDVDHLVTLMLVAGSFQVFATLTRKLDDHWG